MLTMAGPADPPGPPPAQQNGSERREAPRVPMQFLVRDLTEGGSFQECHGDLAVGGAYFHLRYPPVGRWFEVRFRLPNSDRDVRVRAELLRARSHPGGTGFHVR